MRILIAGAPNSGQSRIIETLTNKPSPPPPSAGLTLDHTFVTKYFALQCGLWADEIEQIESWSQEFSGEEAKEVREAIALFIYTFNPEAAESDTAGLKPFVDLLAVGTAIAVPSDNSEINETLANSIEAAGLDIVEMDELVPVVHTALFDDYNEHNANSSSLDNKKQQKTEADTMPPPSRDLDEILAESIAAKNSTTMTNEEKHASAERLADESV